MFFGGFKLQPEKITTEKKYSHLAVSWKLEKITSGKKGTVVWSLVGAQNTKHNTHHRHNNQQDQPCHPTLQGLCSLSLHGWSSGATKSWCRRSPMPCAGCDPSGLRLLSLVCLLGEVKWCVCFWPPVPKWGSVKHEIPISSPPLDDIPSIP
jgi:hypothetical protein